MYFWACLIYLILNSGTCSSHSRNVLVYRDLGIMRILWRLILNKHAVLNNISMVKISEFDVSEHHYSLMVIVFFNMASNETYNPRF